MSAAFLDRFGDRAGEVLWLGSLAWLERVAVEGRQSAEGRYGFVPRRELRRLRADVAGALWLARTAVWVQEDTNLERSSLTSELHAEAARTATARRREGTLEAERARIARALAKREGRELTDEERWPWQFPPPRAST